MKKRVQLWVVTFATIAASGMLSGCASQEKVASTPPTRSARTARHPASETQIVIADVPARIDEILAECPNPVKRKKDCNSREFETLYSCFENQLNEVDDLIISVWQDDLNSGAGAKPSEYHHLENRLRLLRKELNTQFDSWLEN